MTELALQAFNLGKKYRIRNFRSESLRESFGTRINALFNSQAARPKAEDFWALREVSLDIKRGEAVGIIGRNGAGKSTLLKILSQITQPTEGRVEINGRVSSLLEVGTGFHPELTGKENIYLNGTILGMSRREVTSKFEEIVDFSGVEKFLNTPIKHYSSGMKVRLAFSVAAYLEPEVLLIDEVLAVGDSAFQKKCLQKMQEIAQGGITIVFVSHNMQAIRNLCKRVGLIANGRLTITGEPDQVIKSYMSETNLTKDKTFDLSTVPRTKWARGLIFSKIQFDKATYHPGDDISVSLWLQSDNQNYKEMVLGINIYDDFGNCVVHLSNLFVDQTGVQHHPSQRYQFTIRSLNLKSGRYTFNLFLRANEDIQDWIDRVAFFEIEEGNIYGFENSPMISGLVQPEFEFNIVEE